MVSLLTKPARILQIKKRQTSVIYWDEIDIEEDLTALPPIEKGSPWGHFYDDEEERPAQYFPTWRKILILITTSWLTLAATFSSTCIFPAAPEISQEFGVTVEMVSSSNAGTLLAMGLAPFIWGPMTSLLGRRNAYMLAICISLLCVTGAAISKTFWNMVAAQTLAGFEASWFMIAGQAMLADIFKPATRGTAIGFFMAGTAVGRGLGPCVGGIIVSFTKWRMIFWSQVAMIGFGLLLTVLFVPPDTYPKAGIGEKTMADNFNPVRIIMLLIYPNILLTDICYGLLSWVMYSILASPRILINPRFNLTTPLVAGLFYIAPGVGFVVGTTLGGKWADMTVQRYLIKRGGQRIPQDRLNSGMYTFFILIPCSLAVYGWSLQFKFGGLAVPVISIFLTAVGLMVGSSSLNTYCTEVMPHKRTEVMAGKYFIQYFLSAAGNATALPLISTVNVGGAFTINSAIVVLGGALVLLTAKRGITMQRWTDDRLTAWKSARLKRRLNKSQI